MSALRPALVIFLSVWAAGLALFSRHNDFPFYYHPDEPGKLGQVTRNKRNFHHPMLMLTSVDLARRAVLWGDAKKDPQKVVQVGRWMTAAFAALAAAALAALATQARGTLAGIAVGALCLVNPLLYELAHYFKEDPWLAAGIAITCLAMHRMRAQPDEIGFALLGAATAIAAAGKYVGFALLPVAVLAAILTRDSAVSTRRRISWLLSTFAIVWLAFDSHIFKSPEVLWRSVGEEAHKAFGGEEGPTRSVPHAYYLGVQAAYSSPALWFGAGVCLLLVIFRRLRLSLGEVVLAGTALLLFAVFSSTPKTSPRYHLPVSIAISYFAALGAAGLGGLIPQKHLKAAAVLLLTAAMVVPEIGRLQTRVAGFAQDDRADLERFAREKLPATAVIAQDEATNLPEPARRWEHLGRAILPQKVIGKKQIADLDTLEGLRAQGVTHLALCGRTYLRFLAGGDTPEKRFYEDALQRGKPLFTRPPGMITYLQPGLTLLDISHLP